MSSAIAGCALCHRATSRTQLDERGRCQRCAPSGVCPGCGEHHQPVDGPCDCMVSGTAREHPISCPCPDCNPRGCAADAGEDETLAGDELFDVLCDERRAAWIEAFDADAIASNAPRIA